MVEAQRKACWSEERADAVLQTLALANKEPEFLAIHQPIQNFQVSSPSGRSFDATDEALLATLSDPATRYAFVVVYGEPGAGKSHLIRWLGVKWNDHDKVILIERADGSLTGALRQLREALGADYQDLFENLGSSVVASFEGQVDQFHANLAVCLKPGFFAEGVDDDDFCGPWEIARIIGHQKVRDLWGGPKRILDIMSGEGGQRNSESAVFNLFDVADLAALQTVLDGLPPKALMFLRALRRECDRFAPARADGALAEDLELDESLELPEARRLLKALNARRNYAMQGILGITRDGLSTMFLNLRKKLRQEGRRLVLLLEDVTSWEGIDGQLIDAVAVDAKTRNDDVCDMISVVGVTPLYLKDLQGNYGGRISYILRLGRGQQGRFQQTIQLATSEAQVEFASRYLRAIRIGRKDLQTWYRAGADPAELPNRCAACEVRTACFAAFGDVGGVGLYPFNANAITHAFGVLQDPKGKQSLQTPRGMIQGVLSPVLLHPERLDDGEFPPVEIEASEWMPAGELQPGYFLAQVIAAADTDEDRRGQLRRLTMLWGDRSADVQVLERPDGVRTAAGVAQGVFEAFGLPWIGEGLGIGEAPATPAPPVTPAEPTPPASEKPIQPPSGLNSGSVPAGGGTPAGPRRTQNAPGGMTPGRVKALVELAQQWRDRKPLTDLSIWEPPLAELMGEVQKLVTDPAPGVWEKIFTRETVRLEGVGRADIRHFVIPREDWATRGLEAFLQLRANEPLPIVQLEAAKRAVARLLRRLAELAQDQLRRRLESDQTPWSLAAAAAQILLARAWLRNFVAPTEPLWRQFEELLSEDPTSQPTGEERVESWNELSRSTNYYHDKIRTLLRQALRLPIGDGAVLADAGAVAGALADLRANLRGVNVPASPAFSRGLEDIGKLVELASQLEAQLRYVPDREARSLASRKRRVRALLRGGTLSHHLKEVDKALDGASAKLLQAGPIEREAYTKARLGLAGTGLLDDASAAWEALADYLLDADPESETPAATFARVLRAPVASLAATAETLERSEVAISATYRFVKTYVDTYQTDGDLSVVRDFGASLASAAGAIQTKLEEVG